MLFQDQQNKKKNLADSRYKLLSASQGSHNKKIYHKMLSLGNENHNHLEKNQSFIKCITKQFKPYKMKIIQAWPIQKLLNQTSKNIKQVFKNHIKSCIKLKSDKSEYKKKKKQNNIHIQLVQLKSKTERTTQISLKKERLQSKNVMKSQNVPHQMLITINDNLLNNYTKLSKTKNIGLNAYKCRTAGNQEKQNEITYIPRIQTDRMQIQGHRAPKAQILDHYKLKSPRQRPTVPFNNQKIFQSIVNYT